MHIVVEFLNDFNISGVKYALENYLSDSGVNLPIFVLLSNFFAFSAAYTIQDLLKLEKLQDDLAERFGEQPTFAQWAAAAGVDQKTLRKRLNYGISCKDRMIKSNIRLVISIAKNYQGAGMNLQDLVQVIFSTCILLVINKYIGPTKFFSLN